MPWLTLAVLFVDYAEAAVPLLGDRKIKSEGLGLAAPWRSRGPSLSAVPCSAVH